MSLLNIVYQCPKDLSPAERNARTHSKKQIRQIAQSIKTFGFTNPILIDKNNRIVAGHGRVEAAKLLDIGEVPTIKLEELSDAQIRAYVIADNKLAENAGWDASILAIEFRYLSALDLDFDLTVTGFDTPAIDLLLSADQAPNDETDDIPPIDTSPPISRSGDVWLLGRHRLLCGDATDPAAFKRLMRNEKAQLVFTDPPYNVPIDGHVSGLGRAQHNEFAMASGEMSSREFAGFLESVFKNLAAASADGSIHFLCIDWRHIDEMLAAGRSAYSELKNICVWNKSNGGMGSLYRSKHELVFVFKNGTAPHINNVELGRNGRYRTNVWDYAGANTFGASRLEELEMHPTVKPVALIADAILDCSKRGGSVLDCFAGSGSTLIAAERTGRNSYPIEYEPKYVDLIIRRYQNFAGDEAVHEETGLTFSALRAERLFDMEILNV